MKEAFLQESKRFKNVIDKCLISAEENLESCEVGFDIKTKEFVYRATFLYGPFKENKLFLKKMFFRDLSNEELVNEVFHVLSSCYSFEFDFKHAKFRQKFEYY